jgi:hypothetical protein
MLPRNEKAFMHRRYLLNQVISGLAVLVLFVSGLSPTIYASPGEVHGLTLDDGRFSEGVSNVYAFHHTAVHPQITGQGLSVPIDSNVSAKIVTHTPFAQGINHLDLLVNNLSAVTMNDADLFLEFVDITGRVVSQSNRQVILPLGPQYIPIQFDSNAFDPPYNPGTNYSMKVVITDDQGSTLATEVRPLDTFKKDLLPKLSVDENALIWDFGTVAQGALLKLPVVLTNTGFEQLYTYIQPVQGVSLSLRDRIVDVADTTDYELLLRTTDMPIGPYDHSMTISTSDPVSHTLALRIIGMISASLGDTTSEEARPLDVPVNVQGARDRGGWIDFPHNLGPDPESLHPVKVFNEGYDVLWGVGNHSIPFGANAQFAEMFGDGRDGDLVVKSGQTEYTDTARTPMSA